MTFCDNWQDVHNFLLGDTMLQLYHEIFSVHSSPIIHETLVWLLGNLIANTPNDRDRVLKNSFFNKIYEMLQTDDKLHEGFLRNAIWFFSVVVKHPIRDETYMTKCAEIFVTFIKVDDEEIRTDCLSGLAKLTELESSNVVHVVINSEISKFIIGLQNKKYIVSIVRIFGNLLTCTNEIVDYLISIGCIPFLKKFLYHKMPNVRKETLWALSNITAGTALQTKAAIAEGVVAVAVALTKDSDREVVREALLVVSNAVANSDEACLMKEIAFVDCYIWLLKNYKDPEIILITLKSVADFLRKGDWEKMNVENASNAEENANATYFERKGGLDLLEILQFDKSENIHLIVSYILNTWYSKKIEEISLK